MACFLIFFFLGVAKGYGLQPVPCNPFLDRARSCSTEVLDADVRLGLEPNMAVPSSSLVDVGFFNQCATYNSSVTESFNDLLREPYYIDVAPSQKSPQSSLPSWFQLTLLWDRHSCLLGLVYVGSAFFWRRSGLRWKMVAGGKLEASGEACQALEAKGTSFLQGTNNILGVAAEAEGTSRIQGTNNILGVAAEAEGTSRTQGTNNTCYIHAASNAIVETTVDKYGVRFEPGPLQVAVYTNLPSAAGRLEGGTAQLFAEILSNRNLFCQSNEQYRMQVQAVQVTHMFARANQHLRFYISYNPPQGGRHAVTSRRYNPSLAAWICDNSWANAHTATVESADINYITFFDITLEKAIGNGWRAHPLAAGHEVIKPYFWNQALTIPSPNRAVALVADDLFSPANWLLGLFEQCRIHE